MKKRTLSELEGDINFFNSFIKECVDSTGNRDMSFKIHGEIMSYEKIQKLSLEERHSLAINLINDNDFFGTESSADIHKSIRVLYLLGFRELASSVQKLAVEFSISKHYEKKIEELTVQLEHKKITSKGGIGRTNKHKELALKIALDTWENIPNASINSMCHKIYDHLYLKSRELPTIDTIKTWLSKSGLNPGVEPKVNTYDLVIKY